MKQIIFGVFVVSLGLLLKSCDTTDPPDNKTLILKLEDVSCTEAWIKLETTNLQLPATITLKQTDPTGDTKSKILNLNTQDSLLYVDSLLPNQTYRFHTTIQSYNQTSNELNVTTMDTTSHNFTWQVFTFGEHSHSRLNDVAILDANNIWVVGEIYMNDSLGNPDPNFYNLLKRNGGTWDFERIYYNYQGSNFLAPLRTVFAFSSNDIWVGSNQPMHWNGIMWEKWDLLSNIWEGWINKIWGSSSNDLYVVGNDGNIARYLNGTWSRIESGTDVDLRDVWGTPDGTVWACGYSGDYAISALLKISGQQVEKIYEGFSSNQNNGYYVGPISGVWGTGRVRIYLMNWTGIYIQANGSILFLEKEIARFSNVGFGIDGTDDNNIFSCGEGFVGHWNGISYTEYPELYKSLRTFLNVSVKGNKVASVGSDYNSFIYSQAVIALAK